MSTPLIADPAYWQQRAMETRQMADQSPDPADKKTLLEIADAYEHLATRAEAKLASKPTT
jgi:hypothetical protein